MNSSFLLPAQPEAPARRERDMVERLRQSDIFREYQDAFRTATGLPLALRGADIHDAGLDAAKNDTSFCELMMARSATCGECWRQRERAASMVGGDEPHTFECIGGLVESLVPVRIGGVVAAYLQTGQVLLRPPTEARFRALLRELRHWDAGLEEAGLRAAYFRTRVVTRAHYTATVRLVASFARHLSLVSNELVIKEAAAEPPVVARARAFIAEHLGEQLSLTLVARAAHMSPFYFCKVFKSATGLTLTDYIARARIEKVKHLLINPHTRVSEAAYEAGFQSLSQFNRVFRRIEGRAPSDYRDHSSVDGVAKPGMALPFAA